MSIRSLGMVHLYGYLRTHGGAHSTTGTALFAHLLVFYESGRLVAFPIVFLVDLDVVIRADIQAKIATLTSFLIDNDFTFSAHRHVPRSD
jgi:hypothetical protein